MLQWNTPEQQFELWFEKCLLKELNAGSTIILDNAAFHKKICFEKHGSEKPLSGFGFVSIYSIENKWARLKRKLREISTAFDHALHAIFQVKIDKVNQYNGVVYHHARQHNQSNQRRYAEHGS